MLEKLWERRFDAALLGARDGVSRHQVGQRAPERRAGGFDDTALGTARVRHHGIGGQAWRHGPEHALHTAEGDCYHHHVGPYHGLGRIGVVAVYDAERQGPLQVFLTATGADHLRHVSRPAQGARQGAANQADSDDA